jgi:prevent-host-death family protein
LLDAAEQAGFDLLLTCDQNVQYQQTGTGAWGIVVNVTTFVETTTMIKAVSAADANRRFSELLRTVKKGRSVIVTSHGKPVAKISPVVEDDLAAEGARSALFTRLRRERVVNAGRWTRDELYDDAP